MLEKDIENLIALHPDEFVPNSCFNPVGQQIKLGKCYAGTLLLKKDKINKLDRDSEVLVFQIRTIDESSLINKIGTITIEQMKRIRFYLDEILTY